MGHIIMVLSCYRSPHINLSMSTIALSVNKYNHFCTVALCPDPPALVNGMVTFTGNSIGGTATYTCNMGFEPIGSATTTCGLVSGNPNAAVFSPAPPECRREYYMNISRTVWSSLHACLLSYYCINNASMRIS